MEAIEAWHYLGRDGELRHPHDGVVRPIPSTLLVVPRENLVFGAVGLHACPDALSVLYYARGSRVIERVRCSGETLWLGGELCCECRATEWVGDVRDLLDAYARWCALQAISGWPTAPASVREYLATGRADVQSIALDTARAARTPRGKATGYALLAIEAVETAALGRVDRLARIGRGLHLYGRFAKELERRLTALTSSAA